MTTEEIYAAGAAAAAELPPLTDDVLNKLAVILAPLAEQPKATEPVHLKPKPVRRNAA